MLFIAFFMMVQIFVSFPTILHAVSLRAEDNRVKLEVYIESGCPVSQAFLLGELTDVLSLPDMVAIINFKYVPFGNSFYNSTLENYECYDDIECETDSTQMCAMYLYDPSQKEGMSVIMTGANSLSTFPFISCMEANQGLSTFGQSCWESSMYEPGLSKTTWDEINNCALNQFREIMTAGDLATPQDLTTVPWVLVDSVRYDTTQNNLVQVICNAYTGSPLPTSCTATL